MDGGARVSRALSNPRWVWAMYSCPRWRATRTSRRRCHSWADCGSHRYPMRGNVFVCLLRVVRNEFDTSDSAQLGASGRPSGPRRRMLSAAVACCVSGGGGGGAVDAATGG